MRRRDFIAGAVGAGVVLGGGAAMVNSDLFESNGPSENPETYDPLSVEVVAGSSASELTVPASGPTVLEFYATTCVTCNEMMPSVKAVHEGLESTVQMVSVTNERYKDDEDLQSEWASKDLEWPLVRDTEQATLATRYDGIFTPTFVVVDEDGRQQWRHRGYASADALRSGIESGLSDADVRQ